MQPPPAHIPVLPDAVLAALDPRPGETAVDCTVGRGGHAELLAAAVGAAGTVVGVDLDDASLAFVAQRVQAAGCRFVPVRDSFVRLPQHLRERGLVADVVLADLGLSSFQLDDPARGFGFSREGPLDMRYDRRGPVTAADLLATLSEAELADLIFRHGEDPFARTIARKLVEAREREPILTTSQLAELVANAYGRRARASRMHPATRTFMALRIAVNDELAALGAFLERLVRDASEPPPAPWLSPSARIAIISFHSLEDRLVKRAFNDLVQRGAAEHVLRKPRQADEVEQRANPRARSARLRAVRLTAGRRD